MADLSFLQDAIHLVAIKPDGADIQARWFGDDRINAQAWADQLNDPLQRYNIFWTANVTRKGFNKKPSKADIVGVRVFHADVDDLSALPAIQALNPSLVIASGGGYQPIWVVDGSVTVETAEDINRSIQHKLCADHCFNIDRLLRAPGTINWPTPAKIARGRDVSFATLIQPDNGAIYTADAMAALFPPVAVEARQAAGEADVGVWKPLRLEDVDMPPLLRAMCEREAPKGERSHHVAKCCAALGYEGFSNEIVMGLLMCPDNSGLNGHIADQDDKERAARRKVAIAEGKRPERIFGNVAAILPPGAMTEPPLAVETRESGLTLVCAASFAGQPVQARDWIVPELIPDRNVTDLAGDGGTGKSLLALQLSVAVATGTNWLGHTVKRGPVLYISCEDELSEIQRRLQKIAPQIGSLTDLHIADLTSAFGTEMMLRNGLTPLFQQLEDAIQNKRPRLVVIDTRADVFGGDEIDRVQVRSFVRALRVLCMKHDLAIVMLSHPSVVGMQSGTGQSGSTAWGNSVRSRLYLDRAKAADGAEPDPDLRILRTKKNNYGPTDRELTVRWIEGVFVPDGTTAAVVDRQAREQATAARFVELVEEFEMQGRTVNANSGPNYAPAVFSSYTNAKFSKHEFRNSMNRLFSVGRIRNEPNGRAYKIAIVPLSAVINAASPPHISHTSPKISPIAPP